MWDPYLERDIDLMEPTQCNAAHFITGLQPLQERRQLLHLTLFHRVVERLAPALPPDKFLTQQKPGRLIRARQEPDHVTTNTIGDYIRNNDRAYKIPRCHIDQQRNSFFIKTASDWNHLDNTTVHVASVQRFKAPVAATQHQ